MKIRGAELAQWMEEGWPGDDFCWDHDQFESEPAPETTYDTDDLGGLWFQGPGEDPSKGEGYDVGALVRRWRKTRTRDVFTVTCRKEETAALKELLRGRGATVS